ncbi:RNA polymerase subunit sigma [Sporosarcina sp. P18a]|uniref:RNA polymerase subunit sigma n=1 Tax=Sporosarcina sp. P18a TaxID=2048259 RepID=UPI000C16EA05|nr:RNA polymerase subunit sigma [Sporosarcina sp. P18a]PIC81375.1 RNA polymerase subunit sigma [Sporosarcina sp. P18a]
MSLKAIELQIAIPKTFEAGKIAEQKQQQSQLAQDSANLQTEKQALKSKETVLKSSPYAKMDGDKQQPSEESQQREKKEKEQQQAKHPFKGSFVDYSG